MRQRNTVQLNVTEEEERQFEAIAYELGYTWGDKGNQTGLYKAIAHRAVKVEKPADLDYPVAVQVLKLVANKTPFYFGYIDAAGQLYKFTALYAQVVVREGYHYLECWCEETEKNQDLPGLDHNWSFRLDRIPEDGASISPLDPSLWRSEGLDVLPVQFELHGRLAYAYQLRTSDRLDSWDGEVKVITRNITSTFWFIREIIRYGKDCKVLSQAGVRARLVEQLEGAIAHYRHGTP